MSESEGEGGKGAGKIVVKEGAGVSKGRVKAIEGEKKVRIVSDVGEGEGKKVLETREKEAVVEEVRVGGVLVRLKGSKKVGDTTEGVKDRVGSVKSKVQNNICLDNQPVTTKLVKRYRSREEDVKWASRGVVGTVQYGESVPLIQNRVADAGFVDLDIIPFGADKVFMHSLSGVNVWDTVKEAKQFFDLIFSHLICWDKVMLPFQRGAWLRIYGITLHTWNECFCVFDCGRSLRSDKSSLERERLDYARVLISTPCL